MIVMRRAEAACDTESGDTEHRGSEPALTEVRCPVQVVLMPLTIMSFMDDTHTKVTKFEFGRKL